MDNILKIQIWSDIMCPFCYIGKRRIEGALANFEHKNSVEIEWKSFQLDASFEATAGENIVDHLAIKYGKDKFWAQNMVDDMTENAKNSGLDFHFEKAILANSHNAHRLLHLAKNKHLGGVLKEQLLKAYLTDGKDVNDIETLIYLGQAVGLDRTTVEEVLHSDAFSDAVKKDIAAAQKIGVQGVPFFVFDDKYAISGAQPEDVFLETLQKTWAEGSFVPIVKLVKTTNGDSCGVDGCE